MAVDAAVVGSKGTSTGATSVTSTGGTSSAGKFCVAVAWFTNNVTDVINPSVTDSKGNTYTQIGTTQNMSNGDGGVALFKCESGTSGASHTATASFKDGGGVAIATFSAYALLMEISGAAATAFDQTAQGQDTTRPYTVTSPTLSQAAEVVVAMGLCDTGETNAWTSSNMTLLDSVADGTDPTVVVGKLITAATTAVTPSYTRSGDSGDHTTVLILGTFEQAAGGGVSENLTGQAITSSKGTLTPTVSYALTGQSITSTEGTITAAWDGSASLTGQTITSALGTLTAEVDYSLIGQSIASAEGSLSPEVDYGLTGQSILSSEGTITAQAGGDVTLSLTGQTATFTEGTIAYEVDYGLTGQSITSSEGTIGPEVDYALLGRTVTSTEGTITPQASGDVTIQLTGLQALFTQGQITVTGADLPPVPPASGGAPGVLRKRKKRDSGPYMREDQVFGEEFPLSPDLGRAPMVASPEATEPGAPPADTPLKTAGKGRQRKRPAIIHHEQQAIDAFQRFMSTRDRRHGK